MSTYRQHFSTAPKRPVTLRHLALGVLMGFAFGGALYLRYFA